MSYVKINGPVAEAIREYIRQAQREEALVSALTTARYRLREAADAVYRAAHEQNAGELPYRTIVELDGELYVFDYDANDLHQVQRIGGVVA